MDRFNEIERRLRDGRGLRETARALKCSRKTVREVRDGLRLSPATRRATADPLWMSRQRTLAQAGRDVKAGGIFGGISPE